MPKLFYLSEIVKFAIEKEQESYDLYKKLAEIVTDSKQQELFRMLMEEETYHKEFYTEMLSGVKEQQTATVKEDDEYQAYIAELIAASRKAGAITAAELANPKAALEYAIAREKDSVMFYLGLKQFVPASAHAKIDLIISEEAKHAALLSGLKRNL